MNPNNFRILIADDEVDALEFIRYNLNKEGYTVSTALNGFQAIKMAQQFMPHLIILDIMMPEMNGIEACKELRKIPEFNNTLIIFLTARSDEFMQVQGLEVGADDYLTKPIKPRLLVSKVKSLLRRFKTSETSESSYIIKVRDLEINKEEFTLTLNDEVISLPKKEFNLLYLLASKPGKVFTREEILEKVWGTDVIVNDRTIDVHIRKLREKLGKKYISTVKGIGYKFKNKG